MFNAKDASILMIAATATLFGAATVMLAGDLLVGGFMMLVGGYTAIIATLPGSND
jgi:hypothetical protein